eukprot:4291040-Prymnesium_polylepis.2
MATRPGPGGHTCPVCGARRAGGLSRQKVETANAKSYRLNREEAGRLCEEIEPGEPQPRRPKALFLDPPSLHPVGVDYVWHERSGRRSECTACLRQAAAPHQRAAPRRAVWLPIEGCRRDGTATFIPYEAPVHGTVGE